MQLRDTQDERKSWDVFKRKKTVAVLRKRSATIVILKNTMQMNAESQENHNKLLKWRKNWSNKSRS